MDNDESNSGAVIDSGAVITETAGEAPGAPMKKVRNRRVTEITAMFAVVLAACAVGIALWSPAQAKAAPRPKAILTSSATPGCTGTQAKLTVQGTGSASATPDLLTVDIEIDVTEPNAQQALAIDNSQAAAVQHALAFSGVSPKDLQTTNLSIQPNYTWQNNNPVLTGYAVSNTLTVDFHFPFKNAGNAIDAITGIAGNDVRIDSLNFSFQNPAAAQDQARTNAVTQAVAHAQSMALAAGDRLGAVCSITDNSTVQPPSPIQFGYNDAGVNSAQSAVPLQPGSQQETDQVTVVYAIESGPSGSAG